MNITTARLSLAAKQIDDGVEYNIYKNSMKVGNCSYQLLSPTSYAYRMLKMDNIGAFIAYNTRESERGNGIAPEAVEAMLTTINQPVKTVVIRKINKSSIRVAEKLGFALVKQVDGLRIYQRID